MYLLVEWWNGGMAYGTEWRNGMAERNGGTEWRNGRTKWRDCKERQNGGKATYRIYLIYLRYTPTMTTTMTTPFNHLQADRAYGTEISPRLFVISFVILLYAISYYICI